MTRFTLPSAALTAASLIACGTVLPSLAGCASRSDTRTTPSAETTAVFSGPVKRYQLQSKGQNVLVITAPADAPCELSDGAADIRSRDGYVFGWIVPGATRVADAVNQVPALIASEFKEFAPISADPMPIAGEADAMRILGTGSEADDDDPGKADVIVFSRAGRVFIACTHGETLRESARELMVKIVEASRAK